MAEEAVKNRRTCIDGQSGGINQGEVSIIAVFLIRHKDFELNARAAFHAMIGAHPKVC
jgi:hypothetical protein